MNNHTNNKEKTMSKESKEWQSGYAVGVQDGKRGVHDMLVDKDRAVEQTLRETGLGTVKLLCSELSKAFAPDLSFQATVNVLKAQWTEEWRYDLLFKGAFSRSDLNKIDEIARTLDCYYELSGGTVNFSLSIPYKEQL